MTPSPSLLVPSRVQEAHGVHVKRSECESQGDEGCRKADCAVKGGLGRKCRVKRCGRNCFAWLLELPAVGQWSP